MRFSRNKNNNNIEFAIEIVKESNNIVAFTGAGISVESGIDAFRTGTKYVLRTDIMYKMD